MKPQGTGAAKVAPEDRTFQYAGIRVDATFAPHNATVRGAYTVPTGKVWRVDLVGSGILRKTVAAPVGEAYISCTSGALVLSIIYMLDNNVGATERINTGSVLLSPPGTLLFVTTQDLSVGGTNHFWATFLGTEFDKL